MTDNKITLVCLSVCVSVTSLYASAMIYICLSAKPGTQYSMMDKS